MTSKKLSNNEQQNYKIVTKTRCKNTKSQLLFMRNLDLHDSKSPFLSSNSKIKLKGTSYQKN